MANQKILQAPDAINGRLGKATIELNGRQIELMELANITATVDKNKSDFKAIGTLNTQQKANGWSGTGSCTVRYISSRWGKLMEEYANTGKDVYFTMVIENNDPGSSAGTQTVQLENCNFDSIDIAKLDIDSEVLEHDLNFTFSGFHFLNEFNEIN